jgi:hypothetical protein
MVPDKRISLAEVVAGCCYNSPCNHAVDFARLDSEGTTAVAFGSGDDPVRSLLLFYI